MFPIEVFRVTVMKLVDILRENHIRFHITGGMTSVAYGEPRLTQDVDLVVDNQQLTGKLGDFLSALERTDFYFSPDAVRSAVAERKMFQLLDKAETLKLDVYVRELVPGELDRSVEFEILSGLTLPLVSLPDAAVSKLIWIDRDTDILLWVA